MNTYRFNAVALTPVHVGSGSEIEPTEFTIHGNRLIHFNPAQLLNELSQEELNRYIHLLDKADLKAIQSFLRNHLDPARHGLAVLDASQSFRSEFETKASNPNNQFRVAMMPRNPHSGEAYLPGSSIKGAIRTAVVNYFANLDQSSKGAVRDALASAQNIRDRGKILEEASLNRRHSQTERDVFRLVDVEDAPLPAASTRIDRASNFNPNKKGSEKIQIWVERVKAKTDSDAQPPGFAVTLRLDMKAMLHSAVQARLGRRLDLDTIFKACNQFYWKRMVAEGDKFDGRTSNEISWKTIYDLFPKGKTPDGQIVAIEPSKPYWCTVQRKRMLLRVGRFSHFESLSVDEFRQGYNIKARRPISEMGSSRTRCVMENGRPPMPFGWLLLTMDSP